MKLRQLIADFIGGREYKNTAVEFSAELEAALRGASLGSLDWQTAIQVSTVLACARIISEDLCSVPWKIMRDMPDGRKIEDKEHPLWELITYQPNAWQTSFEFRKTVGMHLALAGNAFVWLDRVGAREERIVGFLPIEPGSVQVQRNPSDWTKIDYHVTFPDGTYAVVDSRYIWHIKNHSWDSYKGLPALSYARTAIGLAKDIEKSQSDTHKNFARPSGVLSVDQEMDAQQFAKMRALIDKQVETRLSKGLPIVVDKTMTWATTAIKATDSQTIENRSFQVEEVARDMGVLPIMIGHSDKATTYASAEQMFLHHYTTSTRVWHTNFMQSSDRWLLTRKERRGGYYNHLVGQALLQADTKARGEFYRLLWMIGVITGNEIRGLEDMNRIDGLDRPWAPLANAPIYGEMLVRLGLRYGTEEALKFSDSLFACLWRESYMASALLAEERGAFPACDIAKFMQSGFMQQKHLKEVPAHFKMQNLLPTQVFEQIEKHGMRNVTVNTIAPTGTVSVILETTSGIEPYFDLEYKMTTRIGTSDEQVNLVGLLTAQFGNKANWPSYVVTAQKGISPEQHIKTQATAQKWIDASIAKTVNLPNRATIEDVETAYRLLWELGCKGGTVYRDGSRDEQVFYTHATSTHSVPIAVETTLDAMRPRLEVGIGPTFSVPSPVGSLHVTIRHDPTTGDPEDIFITSGKGDVAADVQALGRLCSLILRLNGVPLSQQSKMELIREQLAGIPGRTQDGLPGQVRVSMPDTIAHVITRYLEGNFPLANVPFGANLVDSLCEDFATMPVDMLKKLALYLKNKTASTPETELEEQEDKQKQLDFCPACGTMSYLVIPGKCGECKSCGYSRCG